MKILGLEIGGKKKTNTQNEMDAENYAGWKDLKEVVNNIFEQTKADRALMAENLSLYNGKIYNEDELRPDESRAYHNLAFSTIQSIAPTLSDNRPIWSVIARYAFTQKLANAYDAALRYLWDKQEMSMVVHEVVLDAMIQKVGLFYVYFDFQEGFGGEIKIEPQDPKTFFIAPGYVDPWQAPFCGIREKKPISLLRKMFPDVKEIKPDETDLTTWVSKGINYGQATDFELENYFATLYVVWMRDEQTMKEIVEDFNVPENEAPKTRKEKAYPNGKFVYFTPEQYLGTVASEFAHGKPPWVPYWNYKKPHDFLGTAELDNIKGLIREYNLQFQKVVGFLRKYADPSFFFDVNQVNDEKFKQDFHKGGQLVPFDSTAGQGKPPVIRQDTGIMVPDIYNILGLIPKQIEEDTGSTDVSKGIASKKQRQSASEIAILVESSYTRTRQRVRNLEWSIKRVCWMMVNLMQQYYTETRSIHVRKDNEVTFDKISNSREFAVNTMISPQTMLKGQGGERMNEREQEEYEDYQKFVEVFGKKDPVYFDFDIEIQTNSSLPLDKQSLANLGVRLFEMKAIDRKALLETLQFPHWEEVAERMDQMEMAQQQGQGGPPVPPELQGAGVMGPQNPLDITAELRSRLGGGEENE